MSEWDDDVVDAVEDLPEVNIDDEQDVLPKEELTNENEWQWDSRIRWYVAVYETLY